MKMSAVLIVYTAKLKVKVKLEIYIADLKAINRIGHAYSAPLC